MTVFEYMSEWDELCRAACASVSFRTVRDEVGDQRFILAIDRMQRENCVGLFGMRIGENGLEVMRQVYAGGKHFEELPAYWRELYRGGMDMRVHKMVSHVRADGSSVSRIIARYDKET